jgi:hypothetical protein
MKCPEKHLATRGRNIEKGKTTANHTGFEYFQQSQCGVSGVLDIVSYPPFN